MAARDRLRDMGSPARAGIGPCAHAHGSNWTDSGRIITFVGATDPIIPDAPARGRSLIAIRSVVMSFCHSQQFGRTLARAGNIHFELAADTRNRGKATLERPPQSGSVISVRRQARIAPDASSTGRPGTAGRKFGSGRKFDVAGRDERNRAPRPRGREARAEP